MRRRRRYARGNYGKKRSWLPILLIIGGVVLALVIGLIILGIQMGKKTAVGEEHTEGVTTSPITSPLGYPAAPVIEAGALAVDKDFNNKTLTEACYALSEEGYRAVSLTLTDDDGRLLLTPSMADTYGYVSKDASSMSPLGVINRLKMENMYVSVCMSLRSLTEKNDLLRLQERAYEAAIICDLLRAGAHEVVILVDAPTDESIRHMHALVEDVRGLQEGLIGLSVSSDYLLSGNADPVIDTMIAPFDFFGTHLPLVEDGEEYTKTTDALRASLYYVLRYGMRVILPQKVDTEQRGEIVRAVKANGIQNYQFCMK